MKRLLWLAAVILLAIPAQGQVTSQRVHPTTLNPPTACISGHLYPNATTHKLYQGNSVGGCTDITAGGGGGATIPSVTNLIKGDGAGNGADSGIVPANVPLLNGANVFTASQTIPTLVGPVNITAVSGSSLTVAGVANQWVIVANGNSTAGQSLGEEINAGTNSSDSAFKIHNQAGNTILFHVRGDGLVLVPGSVTIGAGSAITSSGAGGALGALSFVTPGTGVATALAVNVGSAGAFVVNGGALGTPTSGTVTNLTGTASININGTVGATTPTTGAFTTLTATTSVSVGSSPPTCTNGTGGVWCAAEGTAPTAAASVDMIYADSTAHRHKVFNNNGSSGTLALFTDNLSVFAVSTSAAIGVGTIELGAATDTTLARVSAGVISVEGVTITRTIVNGTASMGTTTVNTGACSSAIDGGTATGVLTTDTILFTPNGDPTGLTGYAPSANGGLHIWAYPTADHVNFKLCNDTAGNITPQAMTVNWSVRRP